MATTKEILELRKASITLWNRGDLGFLLDRTQKTMLSEFEQSKHRKFILLCSRRLGKTHLLIVKALSTAIKKRSKIMYFTDTFKNAKEIVQPLMHKLLDSCPDRVKPRFKVQDSKYIFPNGSEIALYGSDRNPDQGRGQEADLVIMDEAGFMNHLHYIISSVITPSLLITNGRILMATTPPKEEDHDFIRYMAQAEAEGWIVKRTIYDNERITAKQREEFKTEAGGEMSDAWQREYLCKLIRNKETSVLPEFDEGAQADIVTNGYVFNPLYDTYSGMDLGFVDNTGIVMGFFDFANGKMVIQREILFEKKNTSQIADSIKKMELKTWGDKEVFRRIADANNPQFIHDLADLHRLTFIPDPRYGTKEQRINKLRLMIQNRGLIIDPSCKHLISQLKYCRWKNSDRMTFDRTAEYGHFDLVDALVILINNIDYARNPCPVNYNIHIQANIPQQSQVRTADIQKLTSTKIRSPKRWL